MEPFSSGGETAKPQSVHRTTAEKTGRHTNPHSSGFFSTPAPTSPPRVLPKHLTNLNLDACEGCDGRTLPQGSGGHLGQA